MATKKNKKKKSKQSKKTASKKSTRRPRKLTKNSVRARSPKKKPAAKKGTRSKGRRGGARPFSPRVRQPFSGEQSGDLQGLSRRPSADSESVDELVEEGNAFEADAVSGVEEADNAEGREVHTREVPEDDVPGEYLDED